MLYAGSTKHYRLYTILGPGGGEISYAHKYVNKINKIFRAIGGTQIDTKSEYWTSTPFSTDYMYSLQTDNKEFHFWHSKKTIFNVRPITGSEMYIYTE